jgi:hypothetical protein
VAERADELGGLLWDDYTGVRDNEGKLTGNSLSTIDLRLALEAAFAATSRKIDLLYLDACLIGMWEVANEIKDQVHFGGSADRLLGQHYRPQCAGLPVTGLSAAAGAAAGQPAVVFTIDCMIKMRRDVALQRLYAFLGVLR